MHPIEVFQLSSRAKETLASPELFKKRLDAGESILDVFGFSTEALTGFYDAAVALMDEKRYVDASDAFYFLTVMVPNEPLFWLGTARSDWHAEKPAQALGSYLMALGLQPADVEVFLETLRCCIAIENVECAQRIVEQAFEYAEANPEDPAAQKLRTVAEKAKTELAGYAQPRGE